MRNGLKFGVSLALVTGAVISQAGILDWILNGTTGYITSGRALRLYNITDKENLKYGSRTWGINLVWEKSNNLLNVQIIHNGPAGTPIIAGEPVAIYIKGGGYLKHEKRTVGINLGWSSRPAYEWKISGMAGPDVRIKGGEPICLLNTVAQDCVIYDTRRAGINLVWAKDQGKRGWSALINEIGNLGKKLSDWLQKQIGAGNG